jgi:hypothetical protein
MKERIKEREKERKKRKEKVGNFFPFFFFCRVDY